MPRIVDVGDGYAKTPHEKQQAAQAEARLARARNLQWCKDRALEYLDNGTPSLAISSMLSDLGKHPIYDDTAFTVIRSLALYEMIHGSAESVRRWIEGCN